MNFPTLFFKYGRLDVFWHILPTHSSKQFESPHNKFVVVHGFVFENVNWKENNYMLKTFKTNIAWKEYYNLLLDIGLLKAFEFHLIMCKMGKKNDLQWYNNWGLLLLLLHSQALIIYGIHCVIHCIHCTSNTWQKLPKISMKKMFSIIRKHPVTCTPYYRT